MTKKLDLIPSGSLITGHNINFLIWAISLFCLVKCKVPVQFNTPLRVHFNGWMSGSAFHWLLIFTFAVCWHLFFQVQPVSQWACWSIKSLRVSAKGRSYLQNFSKVHYVIIQVSRKSIKKFTVNDEKYSVSIRLLTVKNNRHTNFRIFPHTAFRKTLSV